MKVFVHLAYGFDARSWQRDWKAGKKIGLNEEFPYGYHYARGMGAVLDHSRDFPENPVRKYLRYALRLIFGFDIIHAWNNREGILNADVVWTHTESQSLSVLLLKRLKNYSSSPRIIAQSVWLLDEWPKLGPVKRFFYRKLLRRADILSVLSPLNARQASILFPAQRVEWIRFGINDRFDPLSRRNPDPDKIRIISLGGDRHRDWETLLDIARHAPDIELRVAAPKLKLDKKYENISVVRPANNDELMELYGWADIVVLTLKPNLHASGITVIEEAVTLGIPVICSNVGGLDSYFEDGEIFYTEPGNVPQVLEAIHTVARNDQLRMDMTRRARLRMKNAGLNSQHYVGKHVELSRQLLGLSDDRQMP